MPKTTLDPQELYRLARLGAVARLRELEAEATAIRKAFPGLKAARDAAPEAAAPVAKAKRKKRKKMSAEARKAAAERMKAYWAAKKAGGKRPKNDEKK